MSMVVEGGCECRNLASLHRELLVAGFFIESRGDGASLVLSPFPGSSLTASPRARTPAEGDEAPAP